jgi:hypothetical protein
MSGIKFLLDTNVILGLLKSQPAVLEVVALSNGSFKLTLHFSPNMTEVSYASH